VVAGGGNDGPPYRESVRLWFWADRHFNDLDGAVTLAGGRLTDLDARSFLNVAWAQLVEGSTAEGVETTRTLMRMKFEYEMSPVEQKRAEAFRRTLLAGGTGGVKELAGKMMGARR
jgi:hypothetical protein